VILDVVTQAAKQGKAVVFSTHRMDEAEFLCSRILFLREGSQSWIKCQRHQHTTLKIPH